MEASPNIDRSEDLETSHSFLRAALESTADGLLVVDLRGKIALYNRRFVQMWRIPPALLESKDDAMTISFVIDQLVDPESFVAKVEALYAAPEATSFDVIGLTEGRTFERYSQPQWLGGRPVGRVFSFRDVTNRVHVEEDLRRRTAELQAVLDNMLEPVVACDPRGRVFLANEAARKLTNAHSGQSVDDLRAANYAADASGRQLANDEIPLIRALQGELIQNLDIRIFAGGRVHSLRTSAAPIRNERGVVIAAVSVSRDVTELVELENVKDQFVRVAAHELKTPVAVMKSWAQLALRHAERLPPDLARTLRGVDRGANRIDKVVRSLLDLSQLLVGLLPSGLEEVHRRCRLDLSLLIEKAAEGLPPAGRKRLSFSIARGAVVVGNRERILQVIDALLDNAIRYSPAGGDIHVSLRTTPAEATIEIEDHGVGIAENKQAQIFERFYRPHSGTTYDTGGMGIALFLSREIIREHGGRLWFQSVDGAGSHFFFSLPRAEPSP